MDTTAGIVIFIFMVSILGAFHGGGGQGREPREPSAAIIQNVGISLPLPYFVSGRDGALGSIQNFIRRCNRRLDGEIKDRIAQAIVKYSEEFDVNPKLVAGLIARESSFNPQSVSNHGAIGLGQLLPSTAATLEITDPFDIEQNIRGTAKYIKKQADRWSGHPEQVAYALASYFEGYNAIKRQGGFQAKTRDYIIDIIRYTNSM